MDAIKERFGPLTDMALVRITTYSCGSQVCTGVGININGYVLANQSAIALDTSDSFDKQLKHVYIDEEISLINKHASRQRRKIEFVKAWSCGYSRDFLGKIFSMNSHGDQYYKECSTFVLLATNGVYMPKNDTEVAAILQSMKDSLLMDAAPVDPQKGDKVAAYSGDIASHRDAGLVCYVFESMDLFLVDLNISNRSVVISYPDPRRKTGVLGLTLFQDSRLSLFQMFPMSVTLKHLLSPDCFMSKCNLIPPPHGDEIINRDPLVDISVRVRCGKNLGSGTPISKDKILTCAHVIDQHMNAGITVFFGNQPYPAQVIFYPDATEDQDFAVLLVAPPPAPVISMCFAPTELGDQIFAVGTPYISEMLSLRPFITTGKVIRRSKELVLASCPVHDGFSGGGVFNRHGYLIGMVSGKAYPLNESDPPPRITQIIPISYIMDTIQRYVATPSSEGKIINIHRLSELLINKENGRIAE